MDDDLRRARPRTSTAVRFPPELHERLQAAANERDVSINWVVNKAVEEFLDMLIPVEEMVWTRRSEPVDARRTDTRVINVPPTFTITLRPVGYHGKHLITCDECDVRFSGDDGGGLFDLLLDHRCDEWCPVTAPRPAHHTPAEDPTTT